jgi:hypothetical protein
VQQFRNLNGWQKALVVLLLWPFMIAALFLRSPRFTTKTKVVVSVGVLLIGGIGNAIGAIQDREQESAVQGGEIKTTQSTSEEGPPSSTSSTSTSTTAAPPTTTVAAPTTTAPVAEVDRKGGSSNRGDLYPGRSNSQKEDQERRIGEQPARLAGYSAWVLSAGFVQQISKYEDDGYLRLHVRSLNRDDATQPFSEEDWRLQTPQGQVLDPALFLLADSLGSGELVEGGQVEGDVFFRDIGEHGQYFAIYKPKDQDAARGIWGFPV